MAKMTIEEYKQHLIENYSFDEVHEFIAVFTERELRYFDDYVLAKKKLSERGIDGSEHDEIIKDFIDQFGSMCDVGSIDDAYQGKYFRFRDFSDNLFDDVYLFEIPIKLRCYIDYNAFANDLKYDYSHSEKTGHIFCNNW
jgi:antirestriction protein